MGNLYTCDHCAKQYDGRHNSGLCSMCWHKALTKPVEQPRRTAAYAPEGTFPWAMQMVVEGKKVRRKGWIETRLHWYINESLVLNMLDEVSSVYGHPESKPAEIYEADMVIADWEVVDG